MMSYRSGMSKGFTLVEVLISVGILALVWVSAVGIMVVGNYAASHAKHKAQAIYIAQRILEEERRQPFSSIVSLTSAPVSIDTKGTFSTTTDDFTGNRVVTVTSLDTYRKRVLVEVNWSERTNGVNITKREYCSTDIANETQLN